MTWKCMLSLNGIEQHEHPRNISFCVATGIDGFAKLMNECT